MKREGRPHGMVRTCTVLPSPWNPRPDHNKFNKFDSPPTAGLFTKVQPKPTNHSKFTGKCGKPRCPCCHMNPCCKSKDKTKGCQKIKSQDAVSHYRLMVDDLAGFNFDGISASDTLYEMATDDDDYDRYGYDDWDFSPRYFYYDDDCWSWNRW